MRVTRSKIAKSATTAPHQTSAVSSAITSVSRGQQLPHDVERRQQDRVVDDRTDGAEARPCCDQFGAVHGDRDHELAKKIPIGQPKAHRAPLALCRPGARTTMTSTSRTTMTAIRLERERQWDRQRLAAHRDEHDRPRRAGTARRSRRRRLAHEVEERDADHHAAGDERRQEEDRGQRDRRHQHGGDDHAAADRATRERRRCPHRRGAADRAAAARRRGRCSPGRRRGRPEPRARPSSHGVSPFAPRRPASARRSPCRSTAVRRGTCAPRRLVRRVRVVAVGRRNRRGRSGRVRAPPAFCARPSFAPAMMKASSDEQEEHAEEGDDDRDHRVAFTLDRGALVDHRQTAPDGRVPGSDASWSATTCSRNAAVAVGEISSARSGSVDMPTTSMIGRL